MRVGSAYRCSAANDMTEMNEIRISNSTCQRTPHYYTKVLQEFDRLQEIVKFHGSESLGDLGIYHLVSTLTSSTDKLTFQPDLGGKTFDARTSSLFRSIL